MPGHQYFVMHDERLVYNPMKSSNFKVLGVYLIIVPVKINKRGYPVSGEG